MAASLTPEDIAYQQAHISEDQGPLIVSVSSFLIAITTFVIVLRFVARKARSLPYGWDDWFAIGGLLFTILMCVINIVSVQYGLGKHLLATDPTTGYKILQAGFFLSLVYAIGHWFIKMSILFLYMRIFTTRMRWFNIIIYVCIAYVSGWTLGLGITIVTQCRPLSYFWEQYNITLDPPATGVCTINSHAAEVSTSALNTVADFALLIIPIFVLWQLQLNLRRKIALISVFLVGIFACTAGILRLVTTTTAIAVGTDATWNTADVYLWTAVEASVGLMCACFPIIGPLFTIVHDKFRSVTSRTKRGSGYGESGGSGGKFWPSKRDGASVTNTSWMKMTGKTETASVDRTPPGEPKGVLRTDGFSVVGSRD